MIATAQRLGQAFGVAIIGTALFAALPAGGQRAAPGSLPHEYTQAIQIACLCCLGAALLTVVLVALLSESSTLAGPV